MSHRLFKSFFVVVWFAAFASIRSMAQYGYPPDIPTNNVGTGIRVASTFNPSANITFYVDTNSYLPGSPMYQAVEDAASSWGAYQDSQGGTAQILNIAGLPPIPATPDPLSPIVIFTQNPVSIAGITPNPTELNKDASTALGLDPSGSGFSAISETTFTSTLVSSVNTDPQLVDVTTGLAVHEVAQAYGFGMCTGNSDCSSSVGNDNGNTVLYPAPDDITTMQTIVASLTMPTIPFISTTIIVEAPDGYTNTVTNIFSTGEGYNQDCSLTSTTNVTTDSAGNTVNMSVVTTTIPPGGVTSTVTQQTILNPDGTFTTISTDPLGNFTTAVSDSPPPDYPDCGDCDPSCYLYDPDTCDGGGGGGGGGCDGNDYYDCCILGACGGGGDEDEDSEMNSSPLNLFTTVPAAISFAIVLPFMFTRRRRKGE